MLGLYKKYSFRSIYFEITLVILFWLKSFFYPIYGAKLDSFSSLYLLIEHWVEVLHFNNVFFLFILFVLQIIAIAIFANKYKIFETNTFIAGIVFIIFLAPPQLHFFNPVIVANFFIIASIYILPKLISQKKAIIDFFRISVMLAIATIIYPQYLVFLPLFSLWTVVIIRSQFTKEIFVVILGYIITYLLFFELYYLVLGYMYNFDDIINLIVGENNQLVITWSGLIYLIFIGLILVFSISYLITNIGFKVSEKRTVFQLSLAFMLVIILTYLLVPSAGFELWSCFAIPVTLIVSDFFVKMKLNFYNKFIFWLFILIGFIFYLETYIN